MWIRALPDEARGAIPKPVRVASFDAEHLEVRIFNVGHGEAILVVFPGDRAWLVDGGNTNTESVNDEVGQLLVGYLESRGLTLEACVASHAHIDHVGAFDPILSSGSSALAPVVTVYRSHDGWSGSSKWLGRYHAAITAAGSAVEEVVLRNAHREVEVAPGVVAHLFAGSGDGPYTALFMRLRYHSASLLFTGDAHCDYEGEQLEAVGAVDFRADMLKVTHHGSSSGTHLDTVRAAQHAFAVASTGDDTGHTLEEDTLERLEDGHTRRRVFETLVDGDIIVRTDGQPYRGGVLYRVDFDTPGEFADALDADVVDADDVVRTRTDDDRCIPEDD